MNTPTPSGAEPQRFLLFSSIFYLGMAAVAVIILRAMGEDAVAIIFGGSDPLAPPDHLQSAAIGVGAGLLIVLFTRLLPNWVATPALEAELQRLLRPNDAPAALWLALVSGIGEELLFRGALLPLIGLWPSTLLFAFLHGGTTPKLWGWTFFALLSGLVMAWLTLSTGSLLAPILCHLTVNYWNLLAASNQGPSR